MPAVSPHHCAPQINATDPLVAPPAGQTQYTPDQIHVTMARERTAEHAKASCARLCACPPCTGPTKASAGC